MSNLATLSKHGEKIKSLGYLPKNFPSLVTVRPAKPEDNVATEFVAEDYDGQGVVALKREDFRYL